MCKRVRFSSFAIGYHQEIERLVLEKLVLEKLVLEKLVIEKLVIEKIDVHIFVCYCK